MPVSVTFTLTDADAARVQAAAADAGYANAKQWAISLIKAAVLASERSDAMREFVDSVVPVEPT